MADGRRKIQDYHHVIDYLTPQVWYDLQGNDREKATNSLLGICWQLGLRCPSEQTYSVLYNLLSMSNPKRRATSTFEKYTELAELKKTWKRLRQIRHHENVNYFQYLEQLPADPETLPAEYQVNAFTDSQPERCRDLAVYINFLFITRLVFGRHGWACIIVSVWNA